MINYNNSIIPLEFRSAIKLCIVNNHEIVLESKHFLSSKRLLYDKAIKIIQK